MERRIDIDLFSGLAGLLLLVWLWMGACGGEFRVTSTGPAGTTTHTLSAGRSP